MVSTNATKARLISTRPAHVSAGTVRWQREVCLRFEKSAHSPSIREAPASIPLLERERRLREQLKSDSQWTKWSISALLLA